MKGKLPVRLLYMTPLILSAKAPKQNTFAINLLLGILLDVWHHMLAHDMVEAQLRQVRRGAQSRGTGSGPCWQNHPFCGCFSHDPDSPLQLFHVVFCCCRAGVQVFCYKLLIEIGAPLQETFLQCVHEGQYLGIAQQFVCKFYGICLCLHWVREGCKFPPRGSVCYRQGRLRSTSHTGAGLWLGCVGTLKDG
jgi:hypothetical protein